MTDNGPCLCGDPACPRCNFTGPCPECGGLMTSQDWNEWAECEDCWQEDLRHLDEDLAEEARLEREAEANQPIHEIDENLPF